MTLTSRPKQQVPVSVAVVVIRLRRKFCIHPNSARSPGKQRARSSGAETHVVGRRRHDSTTAGRRS